MATWLPEVGNCFCTFQTYKNKKERDYAASQASRTPGYIKHVLGQWHRLNKGDIFYLAIYWK